MTMLESYVGEYIEKNYKNANFADIAKSTRFERTDTRVFCYMRILTVFKIYVSINCTNNLLTDTTDILTDYLHILHPTL